ncbi:hypothetical protein CDL12_16603 [Handroanthus impetiginosus]|uniref:Transcription factor, Myb superfamily n=1 Tax=Handroanthus impetiginosus TaxID=429701 RepID=A0A2G9GZU7_9LAMI|nr:hypothetical protein CDL12_16603 [Handroanthus impetiginosus]
MAPSSISESEDGVLSTDTPLSDDGDNSHRGSNGGFVLKKGPWTSAEDAILVDYVKKYGEGNWNAVQKHTGLLRCGKSCRLRWANHLRPNLKRGAFTPEEERLIIELHAKMGNKWARMAAHVSSNYHFFTSSCLSAIIKNSICHRAGLPLYPSELCHALPENRRRLSSPRIYGGDKRRCGSLQTSGYETPDVMFNSYNILPYTPEFSDVTAHVSTSKGFGSPQFYSFVPQTIGVAKHAQEQDEPMSDCGGAIASEAPLFDRTETDSCLNKISQPFGLSFPNDPDHTKKLLSFGANQDSHFMSNEIFSASKHFTGAQEFELPSLQYQETGLGVWNPAPKSLDCFVQSPLSGPLPSHCPPPGSSGLLQDVLYEAQALSKLENQSSAWTTTSSNFSLGDITDISALKICSTEFKGFHDPSSPSGNSMGSIFNGCTPTDTIGSLLEEDMSERHMKSKLLYQSCILDGEQKETLNDLICSRPDAVLGSCWVEQSASQDSTTETIAALLGAELGTDMTTSASASMWGLNSCTWNNMPAVCQMSEIP